MKKPTPLSDRVIAVLRRSGPPICITELAKVLTRPRSQVRKEVRFLIEAGDAQWGVYKNTPNAEVFLLRSR